MITKDRLYRPVEMRLADEDMVIEGRAVVYDSPTVLYEADGIEYKEIIERGALNNAKMDDVVRITPACAGSRAHAVRHPGDS